MCDCQPPSNCGSGRPYLADVIEVPVWCTLLGQELLVSIEHHVQVELLLQQHQPAA